MKITPEGAITLVTNVIGIATMVFGMSQDTADVIMKAAPTIVGGVMSLVTVVTYLINKRKEKIEVFNSAMTDKEDPYVLAAKGTEARAVVIGRSLGMV